MSDSTDVLVLQLLEWIGSEGRPYAEVIDAWHTSCPRLPVWEDAAERGYISVRTTRGDPPRVLLSQRGAQHLQQALTAELH
jgi:hypothetical protein